MPIIRQLEQLPREARGGAVAIGNFDGVHEGHRQIAARLSARARAVGGPALIFTFDPHPVRLLRPQQCPPPLTWTERKAELLTELGIGWMVAYPTDAAFLQISARDFFDQVVIDGLGAKALVEGPNFYFGRNREGNVERLAEWTRCSGVTLDVVEPIRVDGDLVSSSRVRRLIGAGDVAGAARLLTQPYRIRGMVTHGAGRGVKIGFPTANLEAIDTLLPGAGVYAGCALVSGVRRAAAIHLGPNPTFGEKAMKVEVHLIDFQASLYGEPLEVEFVQRLRGVQTFASTDALIAQLRHDVQCAVEALAEKADDATGASCRV